MRLILLLLAIFVLVSCDKQATLKPSDKKGATKKEEKKQAGKKGQKKKKREVEIKKQISGTVKVHDYIVSAGKEIDVTENIIIKASGKVNISGKLKAKENSGYSIIIEADKDIIISGEVRAGNGKAGKNGGDLKLISLNGKIILADAATIASGDGGHGKIITRKVKNGGKSLNVLQGGKGGTGGSVILKAKNGSIELANKEGLIHIGNGGNGALIRITDTKSVDMRNLPNNRGGNSGNLKLDPMPKSSKITAKIFSGGKGGNGGGKIIGG